MQGTTASPDKSGTVSEKGMTVVLTLTRSGIFIFTNNFFISFNTNLFIVFIVVDRDYVKKA